MGPRHDLRRVVVHQGRDGAVRPHARVARACSTSTRRSSTTGPSSRKNGKDAITVRQLLSHQAGLAAIREPLPEGGLCDWDLIVDLLAEQEPLWEPGTRHGYHALTFGQLVGELVRRIDGRSLGTFFADEVAGPLGLDFWIGLPEELEPRVAPIIAADMPEDLERAARSSTSRR